MYKFMKLDDEEWIATSLSTVPSQSIFSLDIKTAEMEIKLLQEIIPYGEFYIDVEKPANPITEQAFGHTIYVCLKFKSEVDEIMFRFIHSAMVHDPQDDAEESVILFEF